LLCSKGGKKANLRNRVSTAEEYLEALELTRRARYARDFLLLQTAPEPVASAPVPEGPRADAREADRVPRSGALGHLVPLAFYQLARTLNPMLSPDEAKRLWERIERGPCSSHLAPEERQWIDLMKAVGNRSAPDMARLAEALLAKPSDLPAATGSI